MLTWAEHMGTVAISGGAILLLWAGVSKLAGPGWPRRVTGLVEAGVGVAVLLGPGRVVAAMLAGVFVVFVLVHTRGARIGDVSCDCFGEQERVGAIRAATLTGVVALLAAGAAAVGSPSMREVASQHGTALAWCPAAALVLAFAWRIAFGGTASLARVADVSGMLLERGVTPRTQGVGGDLIERRSFLLRVVVVGSALATAPLRYVLYPGSALAAVIGPWDCDGGSCSDGYTGFCCEINEGGVNACPTGSFAGGWWMCTDYAGRKLCSDQGVRYYVDCNALPGLGFPGGCRCGQDSCTNRRINCNVFRYGQCNTNIEGTTAVVCRMVVCENPSRISDLHCSSAVSVDDAVCGQEAGCLEPPAVELAGAGGV
jgi:hypothetical protein